MYLVSYDISSDKLRSKVAKELLNYGRRVQYSVFECRISQNDFNELYKKLALLTVNMEEGSVRFYHICGKCEKEIWELGLPREEDTDIDGIFIV